MANVTVLGTGNEWVEARSKHISFKYPKLNPVQAAVLPYADQDCNIVVAAATSAGKTVVAEMVMAATIRPKEALAPRPKAIYLAPLKALASEKLDDWGFEDHAFASTGVVLATGDTMFGKFRDGILKKCAASSVLCLTSEMLDSLTRRMGSEKNVWLQDVGVVVVDETHMLVMEDRGDKLESALMRFTSMVPKARLVLLSATMPNVEQVGRWASHLNGKDTVVINSEWRPVQLAINYPTYQEFQGSGSYKVNKDRQLETTRDVIMQARGREHRVLAFVHSKNDGRQLQSLLRQEGETVEFHNADLTRDKRREVERQFRDKNSPLNVIIATSTLAYGLNLPARVVVIAGTRRGLEAVHPYDIRQEVGRAGRFGIDDRGDAFIVLGQMELPFERSRLENLPPISSQMESSDCLMFHIVAEVAEGYHKSAQELWRWYNRSFAAVRAKPIGQDEFIDVLEKLIRNNLLMPVDHGPELIATGLGRVSSWLYYHPLDVADWHKNFTQIVHNQNVNMADVAVAWALARVHTQMKTTYIPKPLQPFAEEFRKKCWEAGRLPVGNEAVAGYAYLTAMTKSDKEVPEGWGMEVYGIRRDAERLAQAIGLIDQQHGRWGFGEQWKRLGLRLESGVADDLVDLVAQLDGVGPEKAKKLKAAGFESLKDIARATPAAVGKVLGKGLGLSAWAQAKKLVGTAG